MATAERRNRRRLRDLTGESESGLKEGAQTTSRELNDFQSAGSNAFKDVLSAHEQTLQTGLTHLRMGSNRLATASKPLQRDESIPGVGFTEGSQGRKQAQDPSRQTETSVSTPKKRLHASTRWKKVLKVALVIAVIVAVCIVAGPLAAGMGAIGLSGLGAAVTAGTILGAAAGATIQMSHNLVDGRAIMDGVGKAAITGAVGGAFGGRSGRRRRCRQYGGSHRYQFGIDAIGGILGSWRGQCPNPRRRADWRRDWRGCGNRKARCVPFGPSSAPTPHRPNSMFLTDSQRRVAPKMPEGPTNAAQAGGPLHKGGYATAQGTQSSQ